MKSIKSQLILVSLILVLVPIALYNAFGYFNITKDYRQQIMNTNSSFANSLGDNITEFSSNRIH